MKKLSICLLIIMCLLVTGCGGNETKEAITLEQFDTILVGENFSVFDNMETYENVDYVVEAKKAMLDNIGIEMIKYSDSDSAERVLEAHIESFNLLKNTGAYEENKKGANYHRYALVSNGFYMISSRVDDTLVFCKTSLDNKETIEQIYEKLGY